MTTLEIVVLVIGLICLVGSFFLSEKLSSSDLEEMKKLSEQEIKIIVDNAMQGAADKVEETLDEKLEEAMQKLERSSDKETNQKIMAISDYSDTVLSSMNKSHDEIVFMYDMLNDKQQKLANMVKEMQLMESAITQMEGVLEEKMVEIEELMQKQIQYEKPELSDEAVPQETMQDALMEQMKNEDTQTPKEHDEILSLYKKGYSEVEIAKTLGRGIGEVKLILELFSEETKE